MNLFELDALDTARHSFFIRRLEKVQDFWICQMIVDGIPRREFLEPHENIVSAGIRPYSYEFETYMKSQSLSMPEEHRG